jgi:hypothetical protein
MIFVRVAYRDPIPGGWKPTTFIGLRTTIGWSS